MLVWCHLAEYLEIEGSIEGTTEKIKVWDAYARQGSIQHDTAGRVVVRLPAELTAANLEAFRNLIDACPGFDLAHERILDTSGTRFVDSSAIGYFMRLKKQAGAQDILLRMVGVQPSVRRILHIAKVDAILLDPAG